MLFLFVANKFFIYFIYQSLSELINIDRKILINILVISIMFLDNLCIGIVLNNHIPIYRAIFSGALILSLVLISIF